MVDEEILVRYVDSDLYYYPIDAGRGCPFSCTYCCTSNYWNRSYRLKSSEKLIEEMKYINEKYNVQTFAFSHDLFTFNPKLVRKFCKNLIKLDLKVTWGCSARVDTLNEDIIDILYKAGCDNIYLGLETGSERMQKLINKNLKINSIESKVEMLVKKGFRVTCSFIYGFLEETEKDLKDTLDLILKLMKLGVANVQLHKLMILPETEEMDKVYDLLFFDRSNVNVFTTEGRYLSNLYDLIESNKDMFPNFYSFNSPIIEKYKYLDSLIIMLFTMNKFYSYIYHTLLEIYDCNLLNVYCEYKEVLSDYNNKIAHSDIMEDLYLKIELINQEIIDLIAQDLFIITGDIYLKYMLSFGSDIWNFIKNYGKCSNVYYYYPINVIKLSKNHKIGRKEVEEKVKIQIQKDDNAKLHIQRIE